MQQEEDQASKKEGRRAEGKEESSRRGHVGLPTWPEFPSELFPLPLKLYYGRRALDGAASAIARLFH